MYKLNKSVTYSFNEDDYKLILELCKVGHVNILSSQVSLKSEKGWGFVEYGDNRCKGLVLPDKWVIEGIYMGMKKAFQ